MDKYEEAISRIQEYIERNSAIREDSEISSYDLLAAINQKLTADFSCFFEDRLLQTIYDNEEKKEKIQAKLESFVYNILRSNLSKKMIKCRGASIWIEPDNYQISLVQRLLSKSNSIRFEKESGRVYFQDSKSDKKESERIYENTKEAIDHIFTALPMAEKSLKNIVDADKCLSFIQSPSYFCVNSFIPIKKISDDFLEIPMNMQTRDSSGSILNYGIQFKNDEYNEIADIRYYGTPRINTYIAENKVPILKNMIVSIDSLPTYYQEALEEYHPNVKQYIKK